MTLTVLQYTGQIKCRLPPSVTLVYTFLMLELDCGFWGEGSQSFLSAIFITSYQEYLLSSHLMTGDINLNLLAEKDQVFTLFKKLYCEHGSNIGILTISWIIAKGNERETSSSTKKI